MSELWPEYCIQEWTFPKEWPQFPALAVISSTNFSVVSLSSSRSTGRCSSANMARRMLRAKNTKRMLRTFGSSVPLDNITGNFWWLTPSRFEYSTRTLESNKEWPQYLIASKNCNQSGPPLGQISHRQQLSHHSKANVTNRQLRRKLGMLHAFGGPGAS